MKLLFAGMVVATVIALSYISIHAYEVTYILQCDIDEAIERDGLKDDLDDGGRVLDVKSGVRPDGVTPGVFRGSVPGAPQALLERRALGVPACAQAL